MRELLAKLFCIITHGNQRRKYTNEFYYTHPFEVARILKFFEADKYSKNVVIAAYLHDTLEDTWAKPWMIRLLFGRKVEKIVLEVTDVSPKGPPGKPNPAGNRAVRKKMDQEHAAKAGIEGRLVKFADMISNSYSITARDPDFSKVYMREKETLLKLMHEKEQGVFDTPFLPNVYFEMKHAAWYFVKLHKNGIINLPSLGSILKHISYIEKKELAF